MDSIGKLKGSPWGNGVLLVTSKPECDYCHDEEPKQSGYCSLECAWRAKEFGSN